MIALHDLLHPWVEALLPSVVASISTASVVLVIALVGVRALRRSAAVTRYSLLSGALVFFVLPAHVLFFASLTMRDQSTKSVVPQPGSGSVISASLPMTGSIAFEESNDWRCPVVIAVFALAVVLATRIAIRALSARIPADHEGADCAVKALVGELAAEMRLESLPEVVVTGSSVAPALHGMIAQKLVVPIVALEKLTPTELRLVLRHELAHAKRRDNARRFFESVVRSLFWFNPFVWLTAKQLDAERELCCDETAVSDGGTSDYLSALRALSLHTTMVTPPASCIRSAKLDERIEHIMNAGPERRTFSFAVLAIAVLATSLTAFATGRTLEPPLLPLVRAEPPQPPSVPEAPASRPAAPPKAAPAAPRPIAAAVPSAPAPPRDASVVSRPVAAPAPLALDSAPPAPPAPAAPAPIAVPLPAPALLPGPAPNPVVAPDPPVSPVAQPAVAPPAALLKVLRKADVSFFVAGIPAMNTHARASLLRTIHASFPSARLASSPKNADVFLVFASDRSSQGAGPQSSADAVRPDGVRTTYDNNGRSVSERTFVRQYKAPVPLPRRVSVVAFATESPEAAVALYDGLDTPNVVDLAIEHLAAMK